MSDDLSPQPSASRRPGPALEPSEPPPAPKASPRPAAAKPGDEQTASRASAKKVFEAKFREPNPRMPFYIAMGALGAFTLGTAGYFWYQLRPPPSLVNVSPPRQAEQAAVASGAATPAATAAPSAAAPSAIPGLPATAPKSAAASSAASAPAPASRPVAEAQSEAPRPALRAPEPRLAPAAAPARSEAVASSVMRSAAQVHPKVEAGYAAYLAGDLAAAGAEYQQALREEPANRDALLGLAALDVRAGRYEGAEALYLRVLQVDPRDAPAQAALIALRSGRSDPLASESRVKTLLAADPSAHALNFALGNQLAQQNRWADFAYNLAVSLDHLRQPRQALDYYQRAIGLSEKRGASFDVAAARTRAATLAR
jgi:tetratricopeptide (TPR) repeat protein